MTLRDMELSLHRRGTRAFIDADYTDIVLIPRSEGYVDGTKTFSEEDPRDLQTFKIIWPEDNGIIRDIGPDGGVRRFDFILLGEYDAVVEIGDTFAIGENNQYYVIEYIYPDNGYEVKAGGVSHGSKPTGT